MTTTTTAERVHTATERAGNGAAPAGAVSDETAARMPLEPADTDIEARSWTDDGKRCELIDGVVVERPPMRMSHSAVAGTMHRLFGNHIAGAQLPFVAGVGASFRLGMSRANFRIPDVHVTALERIAIDLRDEPGVWEGYPDIAVEVVSPTDAYLDVVAKARLYLRQGVAVALLIDARHREVTMRQSDGAIRVLTADDTLELEATLPGFSCPVAEIFADLDRLAAHRIGSE